LRFNNRQCSSEEEKNYVLKEKNKRHKKTCKSRMSKQETKTEDIKGLTLEKLKRKFSERFDVEENKIDCCGVEKCRIKTELGKKDF